MFVLVGDCELMTLMRVLALLLGVLGKLFLIAFAAFRTFSVFFGVKGKLIINLFFLCVFSYSLCYCRALDGVVFFSYFCPLIWYLEFFVDFDFCSIFLSLSDHIPFFITFLFCQFFLICIISFFLSFILFISIFSFFMPCSHSFCCCWLTNFPRIMKMIEII